MIDLKKGNCLELMKEIPDKSIDMILCDLPYGTTACKWDVIIPFDDLWEQYNRIAKDAASMVLFSSQPFTTKLIHSNLKNYKYNWYWIKDNNAGYQYSKYQPMRKIEDICVFVKNHQKDNKEYYQDLRDYFISERKKSGKTLTEIKKLLNNHMTSHYFTMGKQFAIPTEKDYKLLQTTGYFKKPYEDIVNEYSKEFQSKIKTTYNPQGLIELEKPKIKKVSFKSDSIVHGDGIKKKYEIRYKNYPVNILYFKNEFGLHPTQKPVPLLEYLIKTYTNENEVVLDNCMGSGSTGVAAINTNRSFIGIELNEQYYEIAKNRIEKVSNSIK